MITSLSLILLVAISSVTLGQTTSGQSSPRVDQTITVRVLNAKTGEPLKNEMVTVRWGEWEKSEVSLNKLGAGTVEVPSGFREFSLQEGPRGGDEPNRVAYLDCNEPPSTQIQVSLVIEKGFVPKNGCSGTTTTAHPGEVVFWGLPGPRWVPDFQ